METRREVAMAQSFWSNRKTAQQSLRAAAEDLAGEIASLNMLEPSALLQKWKALFGTDPSPLGQRAGIRQSAFGQRLGKTGRNGR